MISPFYTELKYIVNDTIRANCEKVLEKVNEQFFKAPASSTGKYHPNYALGEGGLVRHTRAAVKIAHNLLVLDCYKKMFDDSMQDYIIAALILHDTCKSGINFESKYTVHEHPILAGQLIVDTIGDCEFAYVVSALIETHMGQWNTNAHSAVVLPLPETPEQIFVHTCDYLASKKFIEINFNI